MIHNTNTTNTLFQTSFTMIITKQYDHYTEINNIEILLTYIG